MTRTSNGLSRHIPRWPNSSWFNSLSEADTQDWSTFTLEFLKHFNSVTAQYKAQAEAQNMKLNTHESISIYASCVEDLSNKSWPEHDAKMRNRDYVNNFILQFPFKLKRLANEKKVDHNPTLEEPVILVETLKNYI